MKKMLLLGLSPTTTEAGVRSWLGRYGQVNHVALVREGDVLKSFAIVEMDITDGMAYFIVSRISRYWHDGALVSIYLMIH